ncbi:MAG TPA: Asp-tRNA(Asn)/Glu-tRNA(Gln) amidotransferase GatCAB subunit B [Deltaproteobacteria bacterium]|nr:Asp-tRNA(Asn)/Glu-tRNA(Gln) amidotransferase GatCAB subunit B [Deltaproteobacteria bacterium]
MSVEAHVHYEVVIGLEVHTQLRTESKLFCSCRVRYGDDPNHHTCPVCLALPGALPVLNTRAVEFGVRTALAMNCTVHPRSIFARKNYFYPDLPKGYQISQYEEPLATNGWIEIDGEEPGGRSFAKRIGITRIHMEEDAGKSIHDAAVTGGGSSHVDLNRAGVPLLEIVSEPDLRSSTEAGAYLRTLRQLLRYVDVSDADMEKGHFRCDANVSLRKRGEKEFGIRNEIKNLNSFRYVEDAIRIEIERQARVLDDGGRIIQATRLYDPATGKTRVMRTKENADDYRYFPDPDLVPLALEPAFIERARLTLPELPERRRIRFESDYGLSAYDARLLSVSRSLADFFEAVVAARVPAKMAANWILRDVLQALKEREQEIEETKLTPEALAALLGLLDGGRITAKSARELLPELVDRGGDPTELVSVRGLEAVSDSALIERAADEVIAAQPENVQRFRAGEEKILNFLMGQVMKKTGGKASPGAVREILARKLKA